MKIVATNEMDEIKEFLGNGLDEYNRMFNKNINPVENQKKFGFYAFEGGTKIGGVYGYMDFGNWVWISLLFVDEKHREKDMGTALINAVEKFAKTEKCIGVHLNTFSWQAKGFYEKMGYTQYGELNNHPENGKMFWLKKEF